jgi:hypothetical protein
MVPARAAARETDTMKPTKTSRSCLSALLALLLWAAPLAAPGAAAQGIAVMPFENVTRDASLDWLSAGIPETITNSLPALKGVVLVDRVQLRRVMEEQRLQLSGLVDEPSVVRVGRLTGGSFTATSTSRT